jgi:hypothetical protein
MWESKFFVSAETTKTVPVTEVEDTTVSCLVIKLLTS